MTRHKAITTIKKELQKINEEIDHRIIKGLEYKVEARRHRLLLSQLRQDTRPSWQYRLSRMVTSFLL